MQLDGSKALTHWNYRPFSMASSEFSYMAPLHDSHTHVWSPRPRRTEVIIIYEYHNCKSIALKHKDLTTPQRFSESNSRKQVWTRSLFSALSCRSEPAGLILMICGCHSNQFSEYFSNLWLDDYLNRVKRCSLPSAIAWGSSQVFMQFFILLFSVITF